MRKEIDLSKEEIHKLFSQNRHECKHRILSFLNCGVDVVIDRYSYSGIAYSVASGLDTDWCKSHEKDLPIPDIVFFLDIDPWKASQRFGYGKERFEKLEFQKNVMGYVGCEKRSG